MNMNTSVILPTYNPSEKLLEVVDGLTRAGFDSIIIVDDGSGSETRNIFEALEKKPFCVVLHHKGNRGKGRALKTGFEYFLANCPDKAGVVTTDDDGQHLAEEIAVCAELMEEKNTAVFGVRDFKSSNVPPKSRFGNKVTTIVFQCCCGISLSDTQTGLRALPEGYLERLCGVEGERFEYETNMLLAMKESGFGFIQQPITTIYENNNKSTHFSPIKDSIRIYAIILKYLASSLSSSVLDVVLFTLLNMCLASAMEETERVLLASCFARLVSSLLNYTMNRNRVFRSSGSVGGTMAKYYTVVVVQMLLSYLIVMGFTALLGTYQSLWQTVIKIITDIILFFASFVVQREWVFRNKRK